MNIIPESPVSPPPPISSPSPRAPVRSLAVALVGVFLVFFCALLWLTIAHPTRPAPNSRNRPELLLLGNSFNGLTNLPEVMELTTNLSNADIAFGEAQMDQMIKDRPEFARYVSKHDDVWQFCVRAFAGAAIGEHIIWNNSLPENERYLADHLGPYDGHPGYIQIRKNVASGDRPGRPLTCEELWSCAVFELENIRSHRAFLALYYRALDGKLSREEWIRGCSRLEYEALKRTRNDWVKLWLPLVAARHIRASGYHWGANVPETYEAWISRYWDPNSYPWDVFGDYFDKEMAPFVKYSVARRVGR